MKKMFYTLSLALMALVMSVNVSAQTDDGIIFHADFNKDVQGFHEDCSDGQPELFYWWNGYLIGDGWCIVNELVTHYCISPEILLSDEGNTIQIKQLTRYFTTIPDFEDQAGVYIREVGSDEWVRIPMEYDENINYLALSKRFDIPSEFNGKNVEIGLQYSSDGNTISGEWFLKGIFVRKAGAPVYKTDPEFNFVEPVYDYIMGTQLYNPELNNPEMLHDLVFTSSDENVATFDEQDNLVTVNEGTATLTAANPETEEFNAFSASCTLNVLPEGSVKRDTLFAESFAESLGGFTDPFNSVPQYWFWNSVHMCADFVQQYERVISHLLSPEFQLGKHNVIAFTYYGNGFEPTTDIGLMVDVRIAGEDDVYLFDLPIINYDGTWTRIELTLPPFFNNKVVQAGMFYEAFALSARMKDFVALGVKEDVPTGIVGISEVDDVESQIYDLQGRRLNKPQKGINIIDGMKVIVR